MIYLIIIIVIINRIVYLDWNISINKIKMEGPSYKNKVVLITASSTGIGLGMASYYCRLGAIVIISSRN